MTIGTGAKLTPVTQLSCF